MLAALYVLTLTAVYWIGFRSGLRRGWQYFGDAVEALALAVLALVAVFWVLGQIGDGQPPSIAEGWIAAAIAPVGRGVAVANHLLAGDSSRVEPDQGDASATRVGLHGGRQRRSLVELAALVAREIGRPLLDECAHALAAVGRGKGSAETRHLGGQPGCRIACESERHQAL